jgi:cytochrome P450
VENTLTRTHHEIMNYFRHRVRERRARPTSDLLSHLITAEVDGQRMSEEEVIVNAFNLFLGGAVTTSQAITGCLLALIEQGGGEGRWPAGTPIPAAAEEAVRWSSPTMQFVRHARRDVVLRGVSIREGDAVCACIASANRDERAFVHPERFDLTRRPNPHLAFGSGVHFCVGQGLAKLTLRIVVEEFLAKLDCFELLAPPRHLASSLAAAVVSAPMRLAFR